MSDIKPDVLLLDFRDCLDLPAVTKAAELMGVYPGEAANIMVMLLEELFKMPDIESGVTEAHVAQAAANVQSKQLRLLHFVNEELHGPNKAELLNWIADKTYEGFRVLREGAE